VRKQGAANEQVYTSKADQKFRGLPFILVSADTAGTPEIIAAALRAQARALVIGQRSKGQAAEFADVPLASGRVLRLAVAEARFAAGESLLADGVTPDIPVEMTTEATTGVLKQELEKGVASSLIEPERPRFNEAALVAGTNPELDAMQAAQRLKGDKPRPVLRDQTLLRALDLITSLSVLKR
jgi:carboxyl-terminal processing protease